MGVEVKFSAEQISEIIRLYLNTFKVGFEMVVTALVYIDRLFEKNSTFVMTFSVLKGILLTALTLATKFNTDHYEKLACFGMTKDYSPKQTFEMTFAFLDYT
jgi:hypothetical protein